MSYVTRKSQHGTQYYFQADVVFHKAQLEQIQFWAFDRDHAIEKLADKLEDYSPEEYEVISLIKVKARSNPPRQKPTQAPARMARAGLPRDWLTAVDVIVAMRSYDDFRSCDPRLVTFYLLGQRYPKFTADKIRRLTNLMLSSHPPGR